jgi:hypothetical protein
MIVMMIIETLKAIEKLSKMIISWKYFESRPQSFNERISVISSPVIATGDNIDLFFVNPRYRSIIPRTVVKISALI